MLLIYYYVAMKYQLLKKLCEKHAVTGDTSEIRNALVKELKSLGIKVQQDGYGTVLFGNLEDPKKLIVSHMDEVGFQISKIEEDGKVRILPVGWVFANRFDHAVVYVNADGKKVPALVLHQELLKEENIKDFSSLYLDVGVDSKKEAERMGIRVGQTGSYQREFVEKNGTIIASGIDNKVSQFSVLSILSRKKSYLKENLFAFTTDEEMQGHSANGLCHKYKPDLAVVLDYSPVHHKWGKGDVLGESGKGPQVMYRGGLYIIHEEVRKYFEKKIKSRFQKTFFSSNSLPSLEPANFENNGETKAVNVCIPAFGYHGSAYSVRKKDIEDYIKIIKEILETPF